MNQMSKVSTDGQLTIKSRSQWARQECCWSQWWVDRAADGWPSLSACCCETVDWVTVARDLLGCIQLTTHQQHRDVPSQLPQYPCSTSLTRRMCSRINMLALTYLNHNHNHNHDLLTTLNYRCNWTHSPHLQLYSRRGKRYTHTEGLDKGSNAPLPGGGRRKEPAIGWQLGATFLQSFDRKSRSQDPIKTCYLSQKFLFPSKSMTKSERNQLIN